MSNYHILTQEIQNGNKRAAQVVFHIPVPAAGTNEADISWRDAVVKEQGGASNIVSVLPDITTQEDSDMKAGALIEQVKTVRFSTVNLTNPQRKAEIETYFNTLTVEQRAALTEGDVVNKYKDLKIAKMVKTHAETASKPVEERPAPTVVNINPSGGRPSGADEDDAKYTKEFGRAQETGDWSKVLGLKGYL